MFHISSMNSIPSLLTYFKFQELSRHTLSISNPGYIESVLNNPLYRAISSSEFRAVLNQIKADVYTQGDEGETKEIPYLRKDGQVGIITIRGEITPYETIDTWLGPLPAWLFGMSSIEGIRNAFNTAYSDDSIKGIVLDIDSPGGFVKGVLNLSKYMADRRGKKPFYTFATEACSASYALGCACDIGKFVIDISGKAGSIGVLVSFVDDTEWLEKNLGVKRKTYVSSYSSRKDFFPPKDPEEKRILVDILDQQCLNFLRVVAENRETTVKNVQSVYGGGDGLIQIGSVAVDSGTVDKVGTLEQILLEINGV